MRVAVVGLGLIGGSAALALGARGYDRSAAARARARERGIDAVESFAGAVQDADVVLLAVPTKETPSLMRDAAGAAPDALLTDSASLKKSVVAAALGLPGAARFVGGHPMAGSATAGLEGARADLFAGRPWLIVPTERCDVLSISAVQEFVRAMGALPAVVDADRHDALMTWVSHLPHAVAPALARAVALGAGVGVDRIAGPGLLDATRTAGGSADLALELALADPEALAEAIDTVRAELAEIAETLRCRDGGRLKAYFDEAARAREAFEKQADLPGKPHRQSGD